MSLVDRINDAFFAVAADIKSLISRSMPAGGTTGQVLAKTSSANYATQWQTPSSGSSGGFDATANPAIEGAVSPVPVSGSYLAWSSNLNQLMYWTGTAWTVGFDYQSARKAIMAPIIGTTVNSLGVARSFNVISSPVARAPLMTSAAARLLRIGFGTSTVAGNTGSFGNNAGGHGISTNNNGLLGGFKYVTHIVPSCAALVAGHRYFWGLSASFLLSNNVEPSTLINSIGLAKLSSSSNLFIVYGGTVAQTPIDLGADFPADGLSTYAYKLTLVNAYNSSSVYYRVEKIGTSIVASGILNGADGVALPASTINLSMSGYITNNTTALAAFLDIGYTEVAIL